MFKIPNFFVNVWRFVSICVIYGVSLYCYSSSIMICLPVRGDNARALASGLSPM